MTEVPGPPGFTAESRRVSPRVMLVEVGGEIDMETSPKVEACIKSVAGAGHLVVDLSAVTFLSSTGISLLMETQKRSRQDGGELHLVGVAGNRHVERSLELLGILTMFDLAPDIGAVVVEADAIAD